MSRRSDPKKLAVWRERFERFSSSGLAVGRFCAGEGVSTASFYNWRKRLGHKDYVDEPVAQFDRRRPVTDGHPRLRSGPADGRGRFQQVAVVPGTSRLLPTTAAICIQLPCGTRIEVDAEHLDAVRAVIAEVARVDRGTEAARVDRGAQRTADGRGREAGIASC